MRGLIRCLIAMNWTVAGAAVMMAVEAHPVGWWSDVAHLSREQTFPNGMPANPTTEQLMQWGRQSTRLEEGTAFTFRSGWLAWWGLTAVGCTNAIGLIAVFRRLPQTGKADVPA